jgi:predicted PurR-regulated permease PerM
MYGVVTGYVNGQLLIAAIAATFAGIALLILSTLFKADINPIALAGIVFVFGLIPMFGNILAAIIVVLACLLTSLPLAVAMGIFFILYQQIENATLQPYIQSRSNQLTPLIVFIVALIGVGLAGIIGAIAAIPVAGCVKVLIDDFLKKKFPDYKPYNET